MHGITLIGTHGESQRLEAIVDAGALFTTVPASLLEGLGVSSHRIARFQAACGQPVERRLGLVTAQLEGIEDLILCVFGPEDAPTTIGRHTPEAFLLSVDRAHELLVPRDSYSPSARVLDAIIS